MPEATNRAAPARGVSVRVTIEAGLGGAALEDPEALAEVLARLFRLAAGGAPGGPPAGAGGAGGGQGPPGREPGPPRAPRSTPRTRWPGGWGSTPWPWSASASASRTPAG